MITILAIVAVVLLATGVGGFRLSKREPRQSPPLEDERLQRLEQAVDAIALEIERIAEAQRFTTKLLSERRAEESHTPSSAAKPAREGSPS